MLVLSRRVGETIVIDEHIQVTVLSIQGNRVRIGIEAPPAVRVDRQEVHQRIAEFTIDEEEPDCVPVCHGNGSWTPWNK